MSAEQRRTVTHEHLGQDRIDLVDLWIKRFECWCGWATDLEAPDPAAWAETPLPSPGRVVYGLCPGCDRWQLDAPFSEDPAVIEAAIREHDAEEHPGLLDRIADARRGAS